VHCGGRGTRVSTRGTDGDAAGTHRRSRTRRTRAGPRAGRAYSPAQAHRTRSRRRSRGSPPAASPRARSRSSVRVVRPPPRMGRPVGPRPPRVRVRRACTPAERGASVPGGQAANPASVRCGCCGCTCTHCLACIIVRAVAAVDAGMHRMCRRRRRGHRRGGSERLRERKRHVAVRCVGRVHRSSSAAHAAYRAAGTRKGRRPPPSSPSGSPLRLFTARRLGAHKKSHARHVTRARLAPIPMQRTPMDGLHDVRAVHD
jgi:hypothetical protein